MTATSASDNIIAQATTAQLGQVSNLAYAIWPITYHFLPKGQVAYMLETMYALPALQTQQAGGQHFLLLYLNQEPIGFASYTIAGNEAKLNKLYVLPNLHGQGFGRKLLQRVEKLAAQSGACNLYLNVNRYNPALSFYQRTGFAISQEVDIPIGPFWMNDYVMVKPLLTPANQPETGVSR